jgi:tRNA(Arg) A34 adenosine deaminase TadA
MNNQDEQFLRAAIKLAREGVLTGQGGPFGAVIVRKPREQRYIPMQQLLRDEADAVFTKWIILENRINY